MSKPVILAVDDDPEVLNAVERDLRHHFRADYRVVKAASGAQALDATRQLLQRGALVALFLVDERMPHMSGTQFLVEALKLYPDARRVLLTAYADTETAITAINTIGLDHYLLKPWEPPSERLYPVLDDLLSDWFARARPAFDGIRVAGSSLSPTSYAVKDFLSSNQVPYQWLDVDSDASVRARGASLSSGMSQYLVDRIGETPNIEVSLNTSVVVAHGNGKLESVTIANAASGERHDVSAAAMFIFVGTAPRTGFCADVVARDAQGFVLTGRDVMPDGQRPAGWATDRDPFLFETNVPGIFCAGDARFGSGKRVASAVGEGSATLSMVHQYLKTV